MLTGIAANNNFIVVCLTQPKLDHHDFQHAINYTTMRPNQPNTNIHSDTLWRFRANQFLLLLLNNACLGEKQQIQISLSLV